MTRKWILAALLIAPSVSAFSGGTDDPRRYFFHDATVVLIDGTVCRGLCAGITPDSFRLWQPGVVRTFAFDQMRSLVVHMDAHPATSALYGMVICGYVGFLAGGLGRVNEISFGNFRDFVYATAGSDGAWSSAAVTGILGGMLGYFIGAGSESTGKYDFTGPGPSRQRAIDELRGFASEAAMTRIHIRLSAGEVTFSGASSSPAAFSGTRGQLSCFRRGAVTYSIEPWIEAGAGFVDFSEPSRATYDVVAQGYALSEQSSENLLYCVLARTTPLRSVMPEWVSIDLGAGLGMASVDCRVATYPMENGWGGATTAQISHQTRSTTPGVTIFGGLTLYPDDNISVGFSIDYTDAPFLTLPAVPEFGLDSRTPGNLCVGFEIGLHF